MKTLNENMLQRRPGLVRRSETHRWRGILKKHAASVSPGRYGYNQLGNQAPPTRRPGAASPKCSNQKIAENAGALVRPRHPRVITQNTAPSKRTSEPIECETGEAGRSEFQMQADARVTGQQNRMLIQNRGTFGPIATKPLFRSDRVFGVMLGHEFRRRSNRALPRERGWNMSFADKTSTFAKSTLAGGRALKTAQLGSVQFGRPSCRLDPSRLNHALGRTFVAQGSCPGLFPTD